MCNWSALFISHQNSGVFRAGPDTVEADVEAAAMEAGLYFVRIDLHGIGDKAGIVHAVSAALDFPAYFGMNWDALYDCLTDLSWKPAPGYVMLFAGLQQCEEASVADVDVLTRVLEGVGDYWRQRAVPFYVVLAGKDKLRKA